MQPLLFELLLGIADSRPPQLYRCRVDSAVSLRAHAVSVFLVDSWRKYRCPSRPSETPTIALPMKRRHLLLQQLLDQPLDLASQVNPPTGSHSGLGSETYVSVLSFLMVRSISSLAALNDPQCSIQREGTPPDCSTHCLDHTSVSRPPDTGGLTQPVLGLSPMPRMRVLAVECVCRSAGRRTQPTGPLPATRHVVVGRIRRSRPARAHKRGMQP